MRTRLIVVMGLVCIFGFLTVHSSFAAIYQYVDKDGMVGFADELQSVPEPYRAGARIISGTVEEKRPSNPSNRQRSDAPAGEAVREPAAVPAAGEKQTPATATDETRSFGNRALISAAVVAGALIAVGVLGLFARDRKKTVAIVRVAVLSGMTVYLLYAHAGYVLNVFTRIGSGVESVKKRSEERGKKAARAIKALKALADDVDRLQDGLAEMDPEKKE
jgi:hypothetical protein